MYYSKFQKFLSAFLIFSLLFGLSFRLPFGGISTFAGNDDFFDLVSIIVDEETYDELDSEIKRYASDIQSVLENTRVVILPTPINASAFEIASLNESLYFEGYKSISPSINFESKLVGSVFVGNFNLPIVYDSNLSSSSIVPFTDFEDKAYIYNHETEFYEKNSDNIDGIQSEIWHGVISPNFGDDDLNYDGLKDYFDKNHDYYSGTGNFKYSEGILSGDKKVGVPSVYEPYVFYYDQFREEKALNYSNYIGYKSYLENKEDILYSRFSKELADKISNDVLSYSDEQISSILEGIDSDLLPEVESSAPDVSMTPDIQTRFIVNNVTKKFIEIFAKGTLSDFRNDVYNAGRYNDSGEINADLIPYLVSVLDVVNDEILKDVNDELENQIDSLVKNGLSRNIAIPTQIVKSNGNYNLNNLNTGIGNNNTNSDACFDTDVNFLYGTNASNINSADQCSIYRGSVENNGQLVESNRGLNVNFAEADKKRIDSESNKIYCYQNLESGKATYGIWGGNSPLNLNRTSASNGIVELANHNLKSAIVPIFDIGGSKEIFDAQKQPSPLDCFQNNFLSYERKGYVSTYSGDDSGSSTCETTFQLGNENLNNWSCTYDNTISSNSFSTRFEDFYKSNLENDLQTLNCGNETWNKHSVSGNIYTINRYYTSQDSEGNYCISNGLKDTYSFKIIPSEITHKSPTALELKEQIKSGIAQSLAIDKNRYIDFISAKGDYSKIDYSNLFRIDLTEDVNLNFDIVSKLLDESLDAKSREINNLINLYNPSSLSGVNKDLYNILKNGTYPNSNFSLKKILEDKEDRTLTIAGESKTISYYDTLVFAMYWNSLNSVSAKYGFIFDNFLVDQFGEDNEFYLAKNKKQYEIAYLGAPGDAENMYIKMDPEGKANNPYSNIISNNLNLSSNLLGLSLTNSNLGSGNDNKCAPPDGVPIWEWVPAIMCRIGEMLPPTISLSDGNCGPSLLNAEEKEEFLQCNGDLDQNGINDCIESKLGKDAIIDLIADSEKYYYNTNAKLQALIKDASGNLVTLANNTEVKFEIVKIEEYDDGKTTLVYDSSDQYLNDKSVILDYVTFKDISVLSKGGISDYGISFKSKDANIYLRAYIGINNNLDEEVISVGSDLLKLELRGDRLFNTSYKLEKVNGELEVFSGINSLKVSDKANIFLSDGYLNEISSLDNIIDNYSLSEEKIVLFAKNISSSGKNISLDYPLNLKLIKDSEIIDEQTIKSGDINSFKALYSLEKSGSYKIEIVDSNGYKTVKNIELLPEAAYNVDVTLGTSIMEVDGNISTNFITIFDKYGNPAVGTYYDLEFSLDDDSIVFLDNESDLLKTTTFEGYKVFRLKSTDETGRNNLTVSVFNQLGDEIARSKKEIQVLENINLVAKPLSGDIKVGGGIYKYEVSLRNSNGTIINDFDSRVYLNADSTFLETTNDYFDLKNGVAEIEFKTKTVAGENIPLEIQVEGLNKIIKKELTIYPEEAIKIDLILSKSKIEASPDSKSVLFVELKDRYNNLVFTDNETLTNLEILDEYSHIISSSINNEKVIGGKASYDIYGTLNPGVAYFKVGTNPSLSLNSFIIEDENGELNISGVGENVGKIETFYFWNNEKLEGKKYNSLYTTLVGSNYGDITTKNYLAGSLLFEKDNKALAVTSLLNNSYEKSEVLNLSNNGGLKVISASSDLSQDIRANVNFKDDKIGLSLYNDSLNTYIGKVFYNFDDDVKLVSCDTSLASCVEKNETSISMISVDEGFTTYLDGNDLLLRNQFGKDILRINDDGSLGRLGVLEFVFNEENSSNYLSVNILSGGEKVAELALNFVDSDINISRDNFVFNSKIDNYKNSILVYLATTSYSSYSSGNIGNQNEIFYYNDPFDTDYSLNTFARSNIDGYENFVSKESLGWENNNKTLLAFAAGNTVGESVKDYMSFSLINLGDPVISLKKIEEKISNTNTDKKFDSTVGKLLSNDKDIVGYRVFDYNNDGREDILLIKQDNYFKLLENINTENNLVDKGNLSYVLDLGAEDLVETGDFTGDGYDDIFFVNKEGKAFLLNNVGKDFSRYSLEEEFSLNGRIIRAESFDMDNDGISDIVTLDDFGEINIFYGKANQIKPEFTKQNISSDNGIELSSEIRNDNSLVYFDGLYQPAQIDNDNKKIDNYLFVQYPYSNDDIELDYEKILSGEQEIPENYENKYFLKSEYSEFSGLKVEKRFVDSNGDYVRAGDIVNVEVVLTNTSNINLKNVIYTDKVPDYFELDTSSLESDFDYEIKSGNLGYNFLIDGFDLDYNKSITLTYNVKVRPLKYSYIEVGLFENGELGDDKFGDIIVKDNSENCSEASDIFRSNSYRTYSAGVKAPTCDENKVKLPEEIERNTIDEDENGVPDYIDELTNPNNTDALKAYADEKLSEMYVDSDQDGLPDSEDDFNMEGDITFDLGGVGENIDEGLDNIQDFLNGLKCGFGDASCFASPLNWAPLAPGSDPVYQGETIGDGLNIDEGLPIFSALTWMPIYVPVCVPIPTVWPTSSSALESACTYGVLGMDGAGGRLGIDSITNFFRLFVTPTLTGGVGTAICFGGPASIVGESVPEGVSPLTPGGNCIVVAQKMSFCSDDGSDGDPSSIGNVYYSGDGSFGIINGNCSGNTSGDLIFSSSKAKKYLEQAKENELTSEIWDFLPGDFSAETKAPIFTSGGKGDISVSLDLKSLENGDFSDVIQISQKRISAFPSWLMDWVTRQIEEIVNKLTDFPTLFIILPDFSSVMDGDWSEKSGNDELNEDLINLGKNTDEIPGLTDTVKSVNSGIKEAYEFISNIPLVYITQEQVNINLPWILESDINEAIIDRRGTIQQREDEINITRDRWTYGQDCDYEDEIRNAECKERNQDRINLLVDFDNLVSGLRNNLEAIEEYKQIPEKINKLINKKQDYLDQILCNIEIISEILGGRIGKNGERFKQWVELYILIKAILKSWQVIIDIFLDYEAECKECKNERQDALEEEFSLIDMLMPQIPIITFPKWPDIILDLHNIRAGLNIALPEFKVDIKPILLPSLPELDLPDSPDFSLEINLPEIPVLPSFEIPELPNLPTLPKVELPDLPPPPKLPKLLASFDFILDIIKLVTKAMCILKSSPFHPEWRAGDQIAFLTERSGYQSSDFIELTMPQFSFPFIDAIKVSTYVNLEFETEFVVELAKQIAAPINSFTNDVTNIFDIEIDDFDFTEYEIDDIEIEAEVGYESFENANSLAEVLNISLLNNIKAFSYYLDKGKDNLVTNTEFKKAVFDSISEKSFTENPNTDKIIAVWNEVNNITYSKEDKLIKELQDANFEKFETLKDIINTEIIKNKELKNDINNYSNASYIREVSGNNSSVDLYNEKLKVFNDKFIDSAKKLIQNENDSLGKDLKNSGEEFLSKINTPLENYNSVSNDKLLADATTVLNSNTVEQNSCQANANSEYAYTYEGLYVVDGNSSYRLFAYLDELDGDEQTNIIDIDGDGDEDLLYFMNGQLYLKENLENKDLKVYVTDNPIVHKAGDNKFYNGQLFFEAINNFSELGQDSGNINLQFSAPTNKILNKFRVGFYSIVDKFSSLDDSNYRPEFVKKNIIDSVAGVNDITSFEENELFTKRNNLAVIKNVGNLKGIKLVTKEFINIAGDLYSDRLVNIVEGTTLYAGGNSFTIDYRIGDSEEEYSLKVNKDENIEFKTDIQIVGISGDAFIEGAREITYNGTEIRNFIGKPLLAGAKIYRYLDNYDILNQTYIEIRYYDTSSLSLDFDETDSWELYDLGLISDNYYISTPVENDYYYAKINSFGNDVNSTLSNQVLLAPQIEADSISPSFSLSSIKIPIYKKEIINFTPYLYEDSGIENISEIIIDFDLDTDSDGDGNTKNDSLDPTFQEKVRLLRTEDSIELEFGEFETIFSKKVGVNVIDGNNNIYYREINFEVYVPGPEIVDYNNGLVSGVINEELSDQPINLYRYRGGVISKLEDLNGDTKVSTNNGDFEFNISKDSKGLNLSKDGNIVLNVDEDTGKITLVNPSYKIKVLSSNSELNDGVSPKILVSDLQKDIFYQLVNVKGQDKVKVVDDLESVTEKGIYFSYSNPAYYNYYQVAENAEFNPGAVSIYRLTNTNKESLFTIFKDGRIDTLNEFYKIEYDVYGNYILFRLIDSHFDREVGKVLYFVDGDYIMN